MSRFPDFEKFIEPLEDIMARVQSISEQVELIAKHAQHANPRNPAESLDQIFYAAKKIHLDIDHLKKQLRTAWELRVEAVRDNDVDTSNWIFVEQDDDEADKPH